MAAQVNKKKKQGKELSVRNQDLKRRLMGLDVDPGGDAELGWVDKAVGAGIGRTARLKGNSPGAAGSSKRKD